MSKRNKQSMYQPASPAKQKPAAARTRAKPANRSGSGARPASRSSTPPLPKAANRWNMQIVRITAIIIAVVATVGGIAWAASIQTSLGSFTPIQVVGLVALGFVAGVSIAVALRTDEIVARVLKLRRERR